MTCFWLQAAMQDTAIDPETGAIDMDILNTGISASRRLMRSDLAKELREMLLRKPLLQENRYQVCWQSSPGAAIAAALVLLSVAAWSPAWLQHSTRLAGSTCMAGICIAAGLAFVQQVCGSEEGRFVDVSKDRTPHS